jgi:hypothetical protein
LNSVWFPDLRKNESLIDLSILVKFFRFCLIARAARKDRGKRAASNRSEKGEESC